MIIWLQKTRWQPQHRKERMPYSTYTTLDVPSHEALLSFCTLAGTNGGFHPEELRKEVSRIVSEEKDVQERFFRKCRELTKILERTYCMALTRHLASEVPGPYPKRITQSTSPKGHALKWKTGSTVITLTLLSRNYTFLSVTSFNLEAAQKYATLAKLPEPMFEVAPPPRLQAPSRVWMQPVRDVKIPFGELIDLINRHRR